VSPPARTETPVYLITQVTASEPERLRPYLAGIVPLIERYDGSCAFPVSNSYTRFGATPNTSGFDDSGTRSPSRASS
jgi:hypothetical protein